MANPSSLLGSFASSQRRIKFSPGNQLLSKVNVAETAVWFAGRLPSRPISVPEVTGEMKFNKLCGVNVPVVRSDPFTRYLNANEFGPPLPLLHCSPVKEIV